MDNESYRTVFKTRHGRIIYLEIKNLKDNQMKIIACHYLDRPEKTRPKKLNTFQFDRNVFLEVVAHELDRNFYGAEFISDGAEYDYEVFITRCLEQFKRKYKFLIMVGEGEIINGLPTILKTRLKNRNHRSIYFEVRHYKNNRGVVHDCWYFDRKYRAKNHVAPPTLKSVFFEYNKNAVIHLVNTELNADFTHLLTITDGSIDIEYNKLPLCGNL